MKFSTSALFAGLAFIGCAYASNVLELTPDDFDDVIGKGKPALVEFFAPWCGHCKNLAPVYEQLADAYSHAKEKVVIAKVDADGAGKPLAKKYGVSGYPTLKWFTPDGKDTKYEGGRDLEALTQYVTSQSGVKSNIKPPAAPSWTELDARSFDDLVMDKEKNVMVAFTAPWCGHCKRMKPEYEKVAANFLAESDCVLANVEGDSRVNEPLSTKYKINSFPTIMFFSKDNKEPEDYNGGRTEAEFIEFLNEKCGTQRAVGGGLNELAGRLPDFDSLATKFFTATGEARDSIYQEAIALGASADVKAKQYLKVMEKVVNGSEGYLEKESKRLSSILAKRTLSQKKLDELKVKANVLAAFAAQKVEDAADAVKETAEQAEAKVHEEL